MGGKHLEQAIVQYQGGPKPSPTYLRTCPDGAAMSALLLPLTNVPLRHSFVAGTGVKTRVNCRTRTLGTTPGAVQANYLTVPICPRIQYMRRPVRSQPIRYSAPRSDIPNHVETATIEAGTGMLGIGVN